VEPAQGDVHAHGPPAAILLLEETVVVAAVVMRATGADTVP
jgi:hypothetical protein